MIARKTASSFAAERDPRRNRRRVLKLIGLELPLAPDELTAVERREQDVKMNTLLPMFGAIVDVTGQRAESLGCD